MKRLVWIGTLIAILILQWTVAGTADSDVKIAIVDLRKALNESEAGLKAKASLEEMIKQKQKAIDEKGKEIEALKEEIEKKSSVLSEEALRSKQDELDRKMREYKRFVQDAQEEVKKKENQLTAEILKELREIINEIGKEEGYSVILEKAEGVVLYYNEAVDITQKVIDRYNKKFRQGK